MIDDALKKHLSGIHPLNQQIIVLVDEAPDYTEAGLTIADSAKATYNSGIVLRAAEDCVNKRVRDGVKIGYQRFAGTKFSMPVNGKKREVRTMHEDSLLMVFDDVDAVLENVNGN